MNKNLFASFITPTMTGLPIVVLIIMLPSILMTSSKWRISNCFYSLQQLLVELIIKQMMLIHSPKWHTWSLMLVSLIMFIGSTNLLGLLPHTFIPTTQLSTNLGMAIPLWAGPLILGFHHKLKASLAHFLPKGTPISLIAMLMVIETISLFIQPMDLAVHLTANITAGHLLIHLVGGATLVLTSISPPTATITFILLVLLTILEFALALITLLVSLYLHDNT